MAQAPATIAAAGGEYLGLRLASAVGLRVLADQVEALAVQRASAQGWDWEQIASALHVPRKRLRARYAHRAQH